MAYSIFEKCGMVWRRGAHAVPWRWRLLAAALLAALAATWRGERGAAAGTLALPGAPDRAAHALADFANNPALFPSIASWWVESEKSTYKSWKYETHFSCGNHCIGVAHVWHTADSGPGVPGGPGVPQHGAAAYHELYFTHEYCTSAPLLPLLQFCDELQTWVQVIGQRLTLNATARCSLWGGAGTACRALPALPKRFARLLKATLVQM